MKKIECVGMFGFAIILLAASVLVVAGCSALLSQGSISSGSVATPAPSSQSEYQEVPFKKVASKMFVDELSGKYVHVKAKYQYNAGNSGVLIDRANPKEWTMVVLGDVSDNSTYSVAVVPKVLFNELMELKPGDQIELWAYCQPLQSGSYSIEAQQLKKLATAEEQKSDGN